MRGMWIIGIILAAGEGRRLGGPKALLRLDGQSFLARTAHLLAAGGAQRVVAVLGHQAERVRREAGPLGELLLAENPRYREGMLTSILCGLDQAEAFGADAVLIHPVDHPLIDPATVGRVVAALEVGAVIAIPSFENRRGHPGGFAAAAWPALRAAAADRGARSVLADHPEWVVHVAGDEGCVQGINTREDYNRLLPRDA
jgi:molybdenum cofactor cytidylyltransferase